MFAPMTSKELCALPEEKLRFIEPMYGTLARKLKIKVRWNLQRDFPLFVLLGTVKSWRIKVCELPSRFFVTTIPIGFLG
jgi:hypothetical protein